MQFEFAQVLCSGKGDHAGVVWARTQFTEYDSFFFAYEELYSPYAGTCEGFRYFCRHGLGFLQVFGAHGARLETFAVVAALLYMTDGLAEEGGAVLLGDCEECDFIVERNELFHDDFLQVATGTATGAFPCCGKFGGRVNLALSVSAAAHQGFDDAGVADDLDCLLQFFVGVGVAVVGGLEPEIGVCQLADGLSVHGVVHGFGTWNHLYSHLFAFIKLFGADGFDFGDDDVWLHFIDGLHQCLAVQHAEHSAFVGHLHCRCTGILVASHNVLSFALACDDKFFTQFS